MSQGWQIVERKCAVEPMVGGELSQHVCVSQQNHNSLIFTSM